MNAFLHRPTLLFKKYFFKEINTFKQGHINLIKSDSKDI